jgi:hypothetical protein
MDPKLFLDGEFYPRFRKSHLHYEERTFNAAEEVIQKLLHSKTTGERPGMLLGKVQSGKTRTFVAALAVAFDNGFQTAIILTKNSKALLEQTKKRLESEFKAFVDDGELNIHDIMKCSKTKTFTRFELESKTIFLVKKETQNLQRLDELLVNGGSAFAGHRVILIDDEADNASVGYGTKLGLVEANRIALQVSDIRNRIPDVSYLQVTATPYSLYLQPDNVTVSNSASFAPTRPSFTVLVPVPAGYVGGDTYFGESARSETATIESLIHKTVLALEFDILKSSDRRRFRIEQCLSSPAVEGLRTAILTFIAGGMIVREQAIAAGGKPRTLRYSFLIHSEAARDSHSWQEDIVAELLQGLKNEAERDTQLLRQLCLPISADLSASLKLADREVPGVETVIALVRRALLEDCISVVKVNSDEDVSQLLDAAGQLRLDSPLNIFIGGQVLDRGVTLDRLLGFYYGRRPQRYQQDTVLQHSRMFGYRRDELPVTRFYTSAAIRAAMFEMEYFDSALRSAIEAGGGRTVEFIQSDGSGTIISCSPNKILVSDIRTLRSQRRFLPIGFQSGYKSNIASTIKEIDEAVESSCGFDAEKPILVPVSVAHDIIDRIRTTLEFDKDDDDIEPFDWNVLRSILDYAATANCNSEPGKIYLWAARDRDSARLAAPGSHAKYIETPDSTKTEGRIALAHAREYPILFLLKQNGSKEKGWRDTPFYWPVLRLQENLPTTIYASSID